MVIQHRVCYYVDRDGSIGKISIDTEENGKTVRSENIDYSDLIGLSVGIDSFLSETKRYKGKIFLKKKAFEKFKEKQENQ
jgi:hypothetical protein